MGGKSSSPKPPDLSALAAASEYSADVWADVQREQLAWAKEQSGFLQGVLEDVLQVQLPQLEEAFRIAKEDRQRYEEVFQPIEEDLIREFQEYDTPERREQEAAERMADVRTSFEAQRRNAQQRLEDYGIDPSQTRFQALDLGFRGQEAAQGAFAANQGRDVVEQTGRALRGEAINIGRGLPAQVATSQGIVNQTAGGAVGNTAASTNAQVNAFNPAFQAGALGYQGLGQSADIQSMGYRNSLLQNQVDNQGLAGWGSLAGNLTGTVLAQNPWGIFGSSAVPGLEEGGAVPEDLSAVPGPNDQYPAMLAEDEFVVPADVVRRKGTEFFDKLVDKYRDGGDYEQNRRAIG